MLSRLSSWAVEWDGEWIGVGMHTGTLTCTLGDAHWHTGIFARTLGDAQPAHLHTRALGDAQLALDVGKKSRAAHGQLPGTLVHLVSPCNRPLHRSHHLKWV